MTDPVALTQDLIRCASVTPANDGALELLETLFAHLGLTGTRMSCLLALNPTGAIHPLPQ